MGELIALAERRTSIRRGAGLPGRIEREGRTSLRCLVIDVSRHGACISAPATALPGVFVLRIPDGSRHVCDVLWRKGHMVGVRFANIDQLLAQTATAEAKLMQSCARLSSKRTVVVEETA